MDGDGSDSWSELFLGSGVEEVVLPGTLREARGNVFKGCDDLGIVRVKAGCMAGIEKLVTPSVRVVYV